MYRYESEECTAGPNRSLCCVGGPVGRTAWLGGCVAGWLGGGAAGRRRARGGGALREEGGGEGGGGGR